MSDNVRIRLDFEFKVVGMDDATRTATLVAIPNPHRYEWRDLKDGRFLYDRLDDLHIPESVVAGLAGQIQGMPIGYQPPEVDDPVSYVTSRRSAIDRMLVGESPSEPQPLNDASETFLRGLECDQLDFVIMSVDLVGSTQLATAGSPTDYRRLVLTLLHEVSEAVARYHGHVLKYTGDGVIAYFPAPSFTTKNDLAFDCSIQLLLLVHEGLNPALVDRGLAPVDIRIGLDSGEATIVVIGSPATKRHKDIIGDVVSLACKIQALAPKGGIALGDVTLRGLHTDRRAYCCEMELGPDWSYRTNGDQPYRVHRVHLERACSTLGSADVER